LGILVDMKKNAVVLQKPSSTIAIRADLTLEQRKFYNGLLFVAREVMKKNKDIRIYTTNLSELKSFLSKNEQDKNNAYYKAKIKELMHKVAEYNILQKDIITEDSFVLVSRVKTVENKKTGEVVVNFEIPEFVREKLLNPESSIYANINLVVIRGLQSKYAIILYELCRDYYRAEVPLLELEQFKKIFNIDNTKSYNRMDNLKAKVLDKAVEELNNNENVDFMVNYKLIKTGKTYTYIKFSTKPKPKQKELEQKRDNMHLKVLIDAVPEVERNKQLENYLAKCLKDYDARYLLHQIEYVSQQKPKSFFAYLKKAIEEDYAKAELVEEQERAEKERIERLVQQELKKLEAEKLSLIDMAVDREKDRIYEEYVNLLENNEKQELFNEYRAKTKELYQDVKEGSFLFEETMKRLITQYIISKNEIYQKRLEKIRKDAEEKAERAYQREKETLREKIENGYIRLPLTI